MKNHPACPSPDAGDDRPRDDNHETVGRTQYGASMRAVDIGRIIDRLCQTPGSYQITIVVPVHRRSPWQITYARLEPLRQELASRRPSR